MIEYAPSSNVAQNYLDHTEAMKSCTDQPEGMSFPLDKDKYSLALLRDLAAEYSVGSKAFVVIEHDSVFEVQRLPDGTNIKLFYRHLKADAPANVESAEGKVIEVCNAYLNGTVQQWQTYYSNLTAEMKELKIIPYSIFQRKLGGVAVFKKNPEGAKKKLIEALDNLIKQGYIEEYDGTEQFNLTGKLYKIVGN